MASHIERDSPALLILIYRLLTYVSAITYYLTATINPILYQLMSLKFRLAFKETFGFSFLRPTQKNHHSSIGNTGVGPITNTATQQQQTLSLQTQNQTTTAITYDQSSNNQTIYNLESNAANILNSVQNNSNQNSLQISNLKNGGSSTNFQNSNTLSNSLPSTENGFKESNRISDV